MEKLIIISFCVIAYTLFVSSLSIYWYKKYFSKVSKSIYSIGVEISEFEKGIAKAHTLVDGLEERMKSVNPSHVININIEKLTDGIDVKEQDIKNAMLNVLKHSETVVK
jgi:hypothetical protein